MVSCSTVTTPASTTSGERFAAFCQEHQAELIGRARKVLRNLHDAEDVVQETLAAVWKRSGPLPEGQWLPYARRAVQLNAIKRRMRRKPVASLEEIAQEPAGRETSGPGFSPADLEQALSDLPVTQQAVIRARFYTGLTFAEVAQQLAISQNTVASRCRYALQTLRKRLGEARKRKHQ